MLAPPFSIVGFVKITNKQELDAFNAIRRSGCGFLVDHISLPTKVAEISGHSVVFLPYGGEPLFAVLGDGSGLSGHEVEIALDLLRTVARLHEIRIAHLDIKPDNVLWDTLTHSIRLINFDSSVIVDSEGSQKIKGLLGTSGYFAPEVGRGGDLEYDPFLADAFSCGTLILDAMEMGITLQEASLVRDLSKLLRDKDAGKRWSVAKAMEVWEDRIKESAGKSKNDGHREDLDGCHLSEGLKPMLVVYAH